MILAPDFLDCLEYAPNGLGAEKKHNFMLQAMRQLTQWHSQQCPNYRQVMQALQITPSRLERLEDVPYLPVRLFKEFDLLSVPRDQVFKKMTSSGTSGQQVSRMFLDN